MRDSKGWDGKLRVGQHATIANPDAMDESDGHSDPDAPPVDEVAADEGRYICGSWFAVKYQPQELTTTYLLY